VHSGSDFTQAITSPADQSEKYSRPPCQRGDSTSQSAYVVHVQAFRPVGTACGAPPPYGRDTPMIMGQSGHYLPPLAHDHGACGLTARSWYDNLTVVQLMGSAEPELSATFAALADPTRRAILDLLAGGEATVAELARPFSISQQAVSKHLKVLEQAALIARGRDRQARPCRLVPGRLDVAAGWIEQHRRLWAERYDRLDAHLADLRHHDQEQENP